MKETSTGGARPLAAIDETTFEFGSMEQGKSMTHEFVIFNRGTAPLKLEQGPTTCKCTLSELDNNVIEPGKAATVTLVEPLVQTRAWDEIRWEGRRA